MVCVDTYLYLGIKLEMFVNLRHIKKIFEKNLLNSTNSCDAISDIFIGCYYIFQANHASPKHAHAPFDACSIEYIREVNVTYNYIKTSKIFR